MKPLLNNSTGAITPIALIAAFYLTITSFLMLYLLHEWHRKVEIQYQLDHCMAKKSQSLVERLQAIEEGNLRMQWARMIAAATAPFPPVTAAARAWNAAEYALQMIHVGKHAFDQGIWTAQSGCKKEGSGFFFLPALPYSLAGADEIGPLPLKFDGRESLFFSLTRGSRSSNVALYASQKNTVAGEFSRAVPRKMREILENPVVGAVCKSMGSVPLPTKKWRSAWVQKY